MIIMGYRSRNKVMGKMDYACPKCQRITPHTIVRARRWFTAFFIPIIPVTKKSIARCNVCGQQSNVDNAQADAWFATPAPQAQ